MYYKQCLNPGFQFLTNYFPRYRTAYCLYEACYSQGFLNVELFIIKTYRSEAVYCNRSETHLDAHV